MKKIRIEKKTNVRNSIMRLFFVAVATPTGQGKHTSRRKEDFLQNEKR